METLAIAVQIGIMLFSGSAAWLSMDGRESRRKWAPVFGLLSQPLWIFSAWEAAQFGALVMTVWFTFTWIRGIRTYWIPPGRIAELIERRRHRQLEKLQEAIARQRTKNF